MLVLTRKVGESFVIGDNITVTVVRVAGGGVRIGIEAPDDCTVMRRELRELIESGELSVGEPTEED
ncbi:MAG: carbon storage regulator CsrA [Planctomycetaceae bacterium]|nr:carbon storage regulator CsrA [Planctomycetales bacterium]MCB9875394.1 carbon storage regulator CsrA [Planctomycetaceae bacterium]MCB9937314.1 carbon storage regulator CsrA [Planctomycetaceae bacterium]HRX80777.1 carbon storage regulator CsrA [Pirellulaceae bacterium]